MPWRTSKDPYTIWLSEIILQQTQVAQGTPYFIRFISEFPTLKNLAESTEDRILKLWQGLGYYSRARNMLYTAKYIHYNLKGEFPLCYNDLLKLKGIGEYSAAAIASICYNEPVAVIDGNVIRVISRLFKIDLPYNTAKGKKLIKEIAQNLLNYSAPGEHNQAMMELGSQICKPRTPICSDCPLEPSCLAKATNTITDYPIKIPKNKVKIRHFNFIVPLLPNGKTLITKRTGQDIWKNMFIFPLYESEQRMNETGFLPYIKADFGNFELLKVFSIDHILSHQLIKAYFYLVKLDDSPGYNSTTIASEDQNITENYPASKTTLNQDDNDIKNKCNPTYQKNNIFEVEINFLKMQFSLPRLITKCMESKEVSIYFN